MRSSLYLLLVLTLLGCPGSNVPPSDVGPTYDDHGCRYGCDKCTDNTFCISAPYQPTCVKTCGTDADCDVGQQCALIDGPGVSLGCVAPGRPATCEPLDCHIFPKCRDAKTLLKPLDYLDQVCGWEAVPCVNGCDPTTAACK